MLRMMVVGPLAVVLLCVGLLRPAPAFWPDDIGARLGFTRGVDQPGGLSAVHAFIATLDVKPPALVLAASVTAEGHWTFVSQAGQRYTAARAQELVDVYANLAPGIDGRPGPVVIYLTPASVFDHHEHLGVLPAGARLRVVHKANNFRLAGFGRGDKRAWFAEVSNNIFVPVSDRAGFVETVWQLARPLASRAMRVVALDPTGPDTFRPRVAPKRDGEHQAVDTINPERLVSALATLRGQTALFTGRLEGADRLAYREPTGQERQLMLVPLREAAADSDTNLVFVNASAPRQPGARNWLWLRIEVDGLVAALSGETLGDFLNALAGGRGRLFVEARGRGQGRVALNVIPMRAGVVERAPGTISTLLAELVSEVAGNVVTHAVAADLVSMKRQRELDWRLLAGVPSHVQIGFAAALVVGLVGLPVVLGWWRRVWPPEVRSHYAGRAGFEAARGVRLGVFLVLFLPLAGIPAIIWGIVSVLVWWFGWRRRQVETTTPG